MSPKCSAQPLIHGTTRAADGIGFWSSLTFMGGHCAPTSLARPSDIDWINFFLDSFDILIYKYDAIFWMKQTTYYHSVKNSVLG